MALDDLADRPLFQELHVDPVCLVARQELSVQVAVCVVLCADYLQDKLEVLRVEHDHIREYLDALLAALHDLGLVLQLEEDAYLTARDREVDQTQLVVL